MESLPTLAKLYRRNVVDSPLCSNCGRANESVIHAIWDCDNVRQCWDLGFKKLRDQHHLFRSFVELMFFVKQQEKNVELVTALAWFIWCRRNKCHFNEPSLPHEKLYEATAALLIEFQGRIETKLERKKIQPQRWTPPEQGVYKANYDRAYFVEEEKDGIRVVVRNDLGQVMGSLAEKIQMPSTVEILEALAARRAMIFMEELGLREAIFEGDSELIVKALVGDVSIRSSIGHIVKDYKSLMGLFQTCTFSHVRWQSNGVAHALARRARNSSPLSVWMKSVPLDISYLVYVDVTP